MNVPELVARGSRPSATPASGDPEALMDEVWRLVERIGALATDPERYRVDLIREGVERADLNLIEIGLHRFRDVTPLEDDDD
jgi:hypothetical protein